MKTYQIILILIFLVFSIIGYFFDKRENEPIKEKVNLYRNGVLMITIMSCILLCLTSGVVLASWAFKSNEDNDIIEEYVNNEAIVEKTITEDNEEKLAINFDYLYAINNETVGWLTVNGTNINYPVPQTIDNEYYLNHSFEKKKNSNGWVFTDYRNKLDGNDKNLVIYGHNRINGTLFGTLNKYISKKWIKKNEDHLIKFITTDYTYSYEVFSSYMIDPESYYITTTFTDDYEEFIKTITKRSIYKYEVNLDSVEQIITLSTCSNDNTQRVVVHAKLIEKSIN